MLQVTLTFTVTITVKVTVTVSGTVIVSVSNQQQQLSQLLHRKHSQRSRTLVQVIGTDTVTGSVNVAERVAVTENITVTG